MSSNGRQAVWVWLMAALFYAYEFTLRYSPNVMTMDLLQSFHLVSTAQLGLMTASFQWAYSLMQIPAGVMVDHFGPRRLLLWGLSLILFSSFVFASVHNLWIGVTARVCLGLGASFGFLCTMKLIGAWFKPQHFAKLAGLSNFLGYLGAALSGVPLAYALELYDWTEVMYLLTAVGFILWAMIYFIVQDTPQRMFSCKSALSISGSLINLYKDFKLIVNESQILFNAIYSGLIVACTASLAGQWGVPFLMSVYGVEKEVASVASSLIFLGVLIGSPFFGFFSDWVSKRKLPLVLGALGVFVVLLLLLYTDSMSKPYLYSLSFLLGFFQSAHILNMAIVKEVVGQKHAAIAIGFTNMGLILGGAVAIPLIGELLLLFSKGSALPMAVFNAHDFRMALSILPLFSSIALIVSIVFIRESLPSK